MRVACKGYTLLAAVFLLNIAYSSECGTLLYSSLLLIVEWSFAKVGRLVGSRDQQSNMMSYTAPGQAFGRDSRYPLSSTISKTYA